MKRNKSSIINKRNFIINEKTCLYINLKSEILKKYIFSDFVLVIFIIFSCKHDHVRDCNTIGEQKKYIYVVKWDNYYVHSLKSFRYFGTVTSAMFTDVLKNFPCYIIKILSVTKKVKKIKKHRQKFCLKCQIFLQIYGSFNTTTTPCNFTMTLNLSIFISLRLQIICFTQLLTNSFVNFISLYKLI